MKKLLSILLCTALIFSMLGCQSEATEPAAAAAPETAAPVLSETAAPETVPETEPTTAPTEPPKPWVNNVLADQSHAAPNYYWEDLTVPGYPEINPEKSGITSITFLDTLADIPADARDASQAKDGSVMSWLDGTDLYIAGEGGVMAPKNSTFLLGSYVDVTEINLNGNLHTEQAESMNSMFAGYENKLQSLGLSSFDTSNVTDMAMMFIACYELKTLDVSSFDTSNVTDMSRMFGACKSLVSLDVSSFDTSNVVDMEQMFSQLTIETLDLSNFDTSNVENMNGMFLACEQMKSLDVGHFNTENVTDMEMLFRACKSITSLDLSRWDTSAAENMSAMFCECDSLTDLELGEWEIDSVEKYLDFLDGAFKINGQHWKNLFSNVTKKESNLPKVNASNVIPEPGIPEGGYNLTVHRNVPLNRNAKKAAKTIPQLESILIDDIPIILIPSEQADSMPIYIDLHPGGGSKEDRLSWLQYIADITGGYSVSIDAGAYGESQRGAMTDAESFCMLVTDIEKVIAYCSTLPGADLSRIMIHGNSMGGCGALAYLARGSFKPIFVSALSCGSDFSNVTSGPALQKHGENKRDIPALTTAKVQALLREYSPISYAENMKETFLYMAAGTQDSDGSVDGLETKFQEMGKTNYQFNWYDAGHDLPSEAYDNATALMLETLANAAPIQNPVPNVTITTVSE